VGMFAEKCAGCVKLGNPAGDVFVWPTMVHCPRSVKNGSGTKSVILPREGSQLRSTRRRRRSKLARP
jgi:hypothetical protein